MQSVELKIEGMTCGGCVASVTRALQGVAGVAHVDVSLEAGQARVRFDETQAGTPVLKAAVERAGFSVV